MNPVTAGRAVKALALFEAFTWAGLLAGMFLKYVTKTTEAGVHLFGPIHGVAFLLYLAAVVLATRPLRWSMHTLALAVLAAVPPLATLLFERWARATGQLGENKAKS